MLYPINAASDRINSPATTILNLLELVVFHPENLPSEGCLPLIDFCNRKMAAITECDISELTVENPSEEVKTKFTTGFSAALMPQTNWNAVWESQFSPIVVDGQCTVKATFHKGLKRTRFNITIDPKMAFGTGHHQTTYMMCRALLKHEKDIREKVVMDMGCGTAILAILAAKMGAGHTYGIDIDAVAAASAFDNARINRVSRKVETYCGDASLLQRGKYDILLANINRNILLEDIPTYAVSLRKEGLLFVSGFYTEDLPMICSCAQRAGLTYIEDDSMDNWCCAGFRKQ